MSYYGRSYAFMKCKSWEEREIVESILQEVERMINENVYKIIEQYLSQYKEKIVLEITTLVNGKLSSDQIIKAIENEISNQIKN